MGRQRILRKSCQAVALENQEIAHRGKAIMSTLVLNVTSTKREGGTWERQQSRVN